MDDRIVVNVRGRRVSVPRITLTSIPWFQNYLENNECATSIDLDKPYEPLSHVLNFARTGRTEYLKDEFSEDYAWYGLLPDREVTEDAETTVVTFDSAPLRMVTVHVAGEERTVCGSVLSKLGMISGQVEWHERVGDNEPLYVDADVGHFDAIVHYLNTGDTGVLTPDVCLTMEYLCIDAPPAPEPRDSWSSAPFSPHPRDNQGAIIQLVSADPLDASFPSRHFGAGSAEFPPGGQRRQIELPRVGDFITVVTLHTPGERALDVINSVQLNVGGQVVWKGSTRALYLRNLCEDMPCSEDDSFLAVPACADITGGSGIPLVAIQYHTITMSITTATPDAPVHLTAHYEFVGNQRRQEVASQPNTYNATQIQEVEIVLDDAGACVDEQLLFHRTLKYLLLVFRRENDTSTISSFDQHPLVNLTIAANNTNIVESGWQDLCSVHPWLAGRPTLARRLPRGVYYVHVNANASNIDRMTISLRSHLSRGKVSVIAMNHNEFRVMHGLGGLQHTY